MMARFIRYRLTIILALTLLLIPHWVKAQKENAIVKIKDLEIPLIKKDEFLIRHKGYCLTYNEEFEQANWVAYELTREETMGKFPRTNRFSADPLVKTGTAEDKDYLKSDLDRGHIAPAADMAWSAQSMQESFFYSNISPQVPTFNRGIWEDAEELVRCWAAAYGSVYVISGPVLQKGLPVIGINQVAVPKYYFKVILQYNNQDKKGIGLILNNGTPTRPLKSYFTTIDSVESFTGIDFFPKLPDSEEAKIESAYKPADWKWEAGNKNNNEPKTEIAKNGQASQIKSVQCIALTKSGKRCKKMTKNPNHRCAIHQ